MKKVIWLSVVILLVLISIIYFLKKSYKESFIEDYKKFESIKVGMSEEEVIKRLGEPQKVYNSENEPENYYVEGYSFKKRSITNKVLIYIGTEPIAYFYFDNQNKVEDIFIGGS